MYDIGKISAGLLIFLCIITSPIWYNLGYDVVRGAAANPDPKIPEALQGQTCVAPKAKMITSHMSLLNTWRDKVVRDGDREYVAWNGKTYMISLTEGCMKCHSNKKEFCDQCHNYLDVNPYCWDCHVEPTEETK